MIKLYETLDNIGYKVFVISLISGIMGIGGVIYDLTGLEGIRIVALFSGFFFAIYLVIFLVLHFFWPKETNNEANNK